MFSQSLAISDISANIITTYDYDAYGNVSLTSGSQAFQNDRLFTGREYEKETGLYYYRARFYSPKTGRFLSRDPIGIQDDVNLYAYVENNPVMFTDPDGQVAQAVVGAGISVGLGVTIAAIEYSSTGEWDYSLRDAAIDAGAGAVGAGIAAKAMKLGPLFGTTIDMGVTIGLSVGAEKLKSCGKTHTQPGDLAEELISYGLATSVGKYGKVFNNIDFNKAKQLGNGGFIMLTNNVKKASTGKIGNLKINIEDSLLKPGKYAKGSVQATKGPSRNFSAETRKKINELGNKYGCHSCGSKNPGTKSGNFVPDHQPANAVAKPGESQELYPHCIVCSNRQGGILSSLKKNLNK